MALLPDRTHFGSILASRTGRTEEDISQMLQEVNLGWKGFFKNAMFAHSRSCFNKDCESCFDVVNCALPCISRLCA